MALKAVVDTLDGLPADVAGHYTEADGKFTLGVTEGGGLRLADVSGLQTALQTERGSVRTLKASLKTFEGIEDPAAALAAIATLADLGDPEKLDEAHAEKLEIAKKQLVDKHDKIVSDMTRGHEKIVSDHAVSNAAMVGQLSGLMIDAQAATSIATAEGNTALLLPVIRSMTRIVRDEESGLFRTEVIDPKSPSVARLSPQSGNDDNMTIEELVAELKDTPAFKPAFKGSGAGGVGAEGSDASHKVSSSGAIVISAEDAQNTTKYRAARKEASEKGVSLEIRD